MIATKKNRVSMEASKPYLFKIQLHNTKDNELPIILEPCIYPLARACWSGGTTSTAIASPAASCIAPKDETKKAAEKSAGKKAGKKEKKKTAKGSDKQAAPRKSKKKKTAKGAAGKKDSKKAAEKSAKKKAKRNK